MSDCGATHCVTCSDEAIAMRVVEARPDGIALCAVDGEPPTEVMTELVDGVAPGAELLVHAGMAIARLS